MTFLNAGLFAAGAAAITIPIIIHFMFHRRRKPIVWAAMIFLLEAYKKHQRRLKLEQWLLLAARCLLLLLIALALGRPIAQSAAAALGLGGGRTVYFLLDNSLTSTARSTAQGADSALERNKKTARRLIDSLGPSDRAAVIALGSPAQSLVVPASADLTSVSSLIDQIEPTDSRADFTGAFSALSRELRRDDAQDTRNVVVVISEFRLGSVDVSRPLESTLQNAQRLQLTAPKPASEPLGNVQILSVEPLRRIVLTQDAAGAATVDVRVKLRRTGADVGQASVTTVHVEFQSATGEGSPPVTGAVRWRPGQTQAELLLSARVESLQNASNASLVATMDRDSIEGDNRWRRPVQVRSAVRVGVAARRRFGGLPSVDALEPADWLRLALSPTDNSPIEVQDVDPGSIDAPTLARLDALFIPRPDLLDDSAWRRVGVFVSAGGLVFITPPPDTTVHLWSDAMTTALNIPWRLAREATEYDQPMKLSTEAPRAGLFELVAAELPDLTRSVTVRKMLPVIQTDQTSATRTLLSLDDGSPWLLAVTPTLPSDPDSPNPTPPRASRGLVIYLTSAPTLSWTDLPARPLIIPLVQELVRQGVDEATGGGVFRAGDRVQPAAGAVELAPTDEQSGAPHYSIDSSGLTVEPIRRSGLWITLNRLGVAQSLVAVNADAHAGRTETQTPESVRDWLLTSGAKADDFSWIDVDASDSTTTIARSTSAGPWLSYPLLLAAAIVALLELVMARLFSHASAPSVKDAVRSAA